MDDDGMGHSAADQPIFHNDGEDDGHLTGALKTLYGGDGTEFGGRSKFQPPRPITGPPLDSELKKKDEQKSREAPTVADTIVEEDVIAGRFWGFNLKTQTPVLKDEKSRSQPPWGKLDMQAVLKGNVPVSLVGAAQIYFNAAKYSTERFTGMMTMMDVQDLPNDQFVYFVEKSEDPLRDGFITSWRVISKIAYDTYFRLNMQFDKNPDKKRGKKTLFEFLDKCVKDEQKKWGRGKAMIKLKFERADGDEGDDAPEEEEEDEDGAGDGQGHERLNTLMKMHSRGRNGGEWGLGFGFLTESDVYRVYRIWSRPIYHSLQPPTASKDQKPSAW